MAKYNPIEGWEIIDETIEPIKRKVIINVSTPYPDIQQYFHLPPKERMEKINFERREKYQKLKKYFLKKIIKKIGSNISPRGAVVEVVYAELSDLEGLEFISHIYIQELEGAIKRQEEFKEKFWCVKAIVVAQIEEMKSGLQTVDDSFLLVRAASRDEAEEKATLAYKNFMYTYLNQSGYKIRWVLEKIVDIYEPFIESPEGFYGEDGIEVFSSWRYRKMKPEYYWDGTE